jgi:beta-1,4-mannosyltransferase
MTHARPLVVLSSFPQPRPTTNPYIAMLAEALRSTSGVELRTFTWRRALLEPFDVFHAHWPENLVTGRLGVKKGARQAMFAAFLARLARPDVGVVRTVHNRAPHEQLSVVEHALLDRFDRVTDRRILLNESDAPPSSVPATTILHGHYRDWFAGYPTEEARPGAVLFTGLIRSYKNVPALVTAFRQVDDPGYTLSVVGSPSSDAMRADVMRAAGGDNRIDLSLSYVSDAELVRHVTRSQLVVLPYAEMYNSGALLMSLSLGRHVLVPHNPVSQALADEVGGGWVQHFTGELTSSDIVRAVHRVHAQPEPEPPDLSRREWATIGAQHRAVYKAALGQGH